MNVYHLFLTLSIHIYFQASIPMATTQMTPQGHYQETTQRTNQVTNQLTPQHTPHNHDSLLVTPKSFSRHSIYDSSQLIINNNGDVDTSQDDIDDKDNKFDEIVNNYIVNKLPLKTIGSYYRPYDIAVFLSRFIPFKILNLKISKYQIITYLMKLNYVPLKRTAINKLVNRFKLDGLPSNVTWTQVSKCGRKPFLSKKTL